MKNTKSTLLSIAIIAALPFTANAEQTFVSTPTPAAVGANGTVNMAAAGKDSSNPFMPKFPKRNQNKGTAPEPKKK